MAISRLRKNRPGRDRDAPKSAVREEVVPAPADGAEQAPPKPQVKVSAIVVSHNRKALLKRCIDALEASAGREFLEVIVIDNGSTDGSPDLEADYPQNQFLKLPRNFGLTKALNIGIRSAKGEFLLFLHADAEVGVNTVSALAACLDEEPDATAACPLLVFPDGEPAPQLCALPSPDDPFPEFAPAGAAEAKTPVACASGAVLMVRKFLIQSIRHIEERYGQFGSDIELCAQIRRGGKKIMMVSAARATHHTRAEPEEASRRAQYDTDRALGTLAFIQKYYGFTAALRIRLGLGFRYLFAAFASLVRARDAGYCFRRLTLLLQGQKIDGTQFLA